MSSAHFVVKSIHNNLKRNRFAIIIGKKAEKKATRRHYWKRRLVAVAVAWPQMSRDFLITCPTNLSALTAGNFKKEITELTNEIRGQVPGERGNRGRKF